MTDKHRCSLSGHSGIFDPSQSGVRPHTYIHTLCVSHAARGVCRERCAHLSTLTFHRRHHYRCYEHTEPSRVVERSVVMTCTCKECREADCQANVFVVASAMCFYNPDVRTVGKPRLAACLEKPETPPRPKPAGRSVCHHTSSAFLL